MSFQLTLRTLLMICLPPAAAICQNAPAANGSLAQHSRAAQEYLQQKRPDLAIPELQKVVALDPGNVDAHGNLGVLLYFRGDYAAAAPELRTAVKLEPDLWKIQALLGLAEAQLHDPKSSDDLSAAFPHLQEEKLKEEVGSTLIANYTASGDIDKAATVNASLLDLRPNDPARLFMAYQLYSQLADKTMLSLALAAPGSAQMHQVMARELIRHGDNAAAIGNYREALKADPRLPGAHYELGNALYNDDSEQAKAEAEGEFRLALDTNPRDEKASLMLGVIAAKRSDWNTALSYDARALGLQPDDPDACMELAKALAATNEREKAAHLIEHAIEIDPTDYIAHYRLSTLYRQQGKQAAAEAQLAEYRKYKAMKEKLQEIFHDMRVTSSKDALAEDADAPQ